MWVRILLLSMLLCCAACARHSDNALGASAAPASSGLGISAANAATAAAGTSGRVVHARGGFASSPDRGDLVSYPAKPATRLDGAYTWHRADLSEAHALRAVTSGSMQVTTPSGEVLNYRYVRHVEHPSGDWTWVGRLENGGKADEAIITFGEKGAFGTISQPNKPALRLTVSGGVSWLVETDPAQIGDINNEATRPRVPDYRLPPRKGVKDTQWQGSVGALANAMTPAGASTASSTVDVLLGYTAGFAAANNGAPETRLNNMIEIANQAYINSAIDMRVRLVRSMLVDYPDNTSNGTALEEMTGFRSPSTRTTPAAAFNALRAAREQYGADLVSLVRRFNTPENDGCGIAWLVGGEQSGIDQSDEFFGYSVVSDGRDAGTDGKTYFCREETLAHELGHNMGAQHDVDTAKGTNGVLDADEYGAYPYSFGYKTAAGAGNFYTVMAYGDTGQTGYRVFSNPRITFCSAPPPAVQAACGVDGQADNARTLGNTVAAVAGFRVSSVQSSDLFIIAKMGGSMTTEAHALGSASNFQSFTRHTATALTQTGTDYAFRFALGDFNRDGIGDIYVIRRMGAGTEVHVLDGATNYQTFLLHVATALHVTGAANDWQFKLGNFDGDGILDLYVVYRQGNSGHTEVHVLNGATYFTSFSLHVATILHQTGSDGSWDFALGDYNRDGVQDVYAISKLGPGSGTTEVHILNGANYFQSYLLNVASALPRTGSDNRWVFKVGDYNGDGIPDVYGIDKLGASTTEIHVLDGANFYRTRTADIATALHPTGSDDAWEFELVRP